MKTLIGLLLTATLFTTNPMTVQGGAYVDRIKDNNIVVIEVEYGEMKEVPVSDFNQKVKEGDHINSKTVVGSITNTFEDLDGNTYYQFKSYDNEVWWCGTADEIGFVPVEGKEYILCYYDNGTVEEYDDILLALWESRV